MDLGSMLYNNLKDVTWSTTSLSLDQLVSTYRLPQIAKLDSGQLVEGLRENDYLLIHSCRQWTTITAHSLEEGHYVIGPKIEIPVHYEGQFKLLEQDRDVKEPVQYFNSVEEVAKAFPERVYVMEEITFNVKMASGESNEDTEVYNITLSTGDELTLMGQAEILYAKSSKEKSRFNTIFKKIGKLNSISKMCRGKMPCLICMNHRTNESISLPFQCKGRFSTCSPLELQMQDGEHTIRNIVEKTRLPVNVTVTSSPPRNHHDLHLIREGHRYKLVNIQTKTVVVCCVLRSNKIIPVHFHFQPSMPKFIVPEELLQGELWLDTMVHRWFSFCQEQFDIDDYSRAVRDVRTDWTDDGKSPNKSTANGSGGVGGGSNSNGCPTHMHVPSSLTYARDELTQSFHRLSVCVYGNNLHGNSEVNLQGCTTLCGDWTLLPSDNVPSELGESEHLFSELLETTNQPPALNKSDVPYEELWLDRMGTQMPKTSEGIRGSNNGCSTSGALPYPGALSPITSLDVSLTPPPVPPKSEANTDTLLMSSTFPGGMMLTVGTALSEALLDLNMSFLTQSDQKELSQLQQVKEECRLLNAPPIPPRSSKQMPSVPILSKPRQQETRSPSPTLSYYSSGLHNISSGSPELEPTDPVEQGQMCYPCNWAKTKSNSLEPPASTLPAPLPSSGMSSRLSWPNHFTREDSQCMEEFLPSGCRSYYSYPRKRTLSSQKTCTSSLVDFDRGDNSHASSNVRLQTMSLNQFCVKSSSYNSEMHRDNKPIEESNTKQSLSCPILPPRTAKGNAMKTSTEEELACDNKQDNSEFSIEQQNTTEASSSNSASPNCPASQWQPPSSLAGLSIEEVSKSLKFIGLPDDIVLLFVSEKIDGNLLLQLTEEILSEDFKLSKLQVKKLMQFMNGWRPKI